MAGERIAAQAEYQRVEVGARIAALVLVFALMLVGQSLPEQRSDLLLLALLATAGALPVRNPVVRRWRPVVEEVAAAAIITTAYIPSPMLPYLVVPALSAGLIGGWSLALTSAGSAVLVLMARGLVDPEAYPDVSYFSEMSQWILLAVAVGLLGSWLRRVQTERSTDVESYAQAARLLAQLRDVSRQLSGGLDAVSLAQADLEAVDRVCPFERGSLFTRSPGGLMVMLAASGYGPMRWEPDLASDGVWAQTWRTGEPHRSRSGFTQDPTMVSVVLPLTLGSGTSGLVGLERRGVMFSDEEVAAAAQVLEDRATRLDAAQLFDEVRVLATSEERRRVAREIHDGIAQELASLGYAVDELAAQAGDANQGLRESLVGLRAEVSRVITELRLSIFDLRTEVGPSTSLTAVLAEHARVVGAQSGLTVHLELAETPSRLRVEVETELLRIAQEAIANARKHAGAHNLWVTCRIDPPEVLLRVADDGRGLAPGRDDSFGFEIMRERTARIGGSLEVAERPGGGTVVQVKTVSTRGGRAR